MKFSDIHFQYFNTHSGAFSTLTERENYDSQLTVTKDEKKIILEYFGEHNILKGGKSNNPELALKKFLLYPEMLPVELNLVFPKPNKNELRLYLSAEHGFKPDGGDIWFTYIDKNQNLVIGSMTESQWNQIEFDLKAGVESFQTEIEEVE